ncbi:MAG TPA: glycosyltransferase family 1 protein [Methanothermococcus okinawensis]|nr:glycosyltransferase family 1 protein [Methanothermococcus okinawensis]
MRILFITRKYPPSKGGMETVAYNLYTHISKLTEVELISWGKSNIWLPIVLPYFFVKAIKILLTKKIDVIYLQDGLLAPLGLVLKVFRKPVVITIHGLDITYRNKIYQFLVPRCTKYLDKIICVSHATKEECIKRGIPAEKLIVIPNGISGVSNVVHENTITYKQKVFNQLNIPDNKKILLSVGRLVERKGFHWFVEDIIPKLLEVRDDFVYLIVGDGPYRKKIEKIIDKKDLRKYVVLLGRVDDEMLESLYNIADIFVMPNIPVEGDMEGFGVVILEANVHGVPVVASNLEGIKDAVINGETGILVEPLNTQRFVEEVLKMMDVIEKNGAIKRKIRDIIIEKYSWDNISKKYLEVFNNLKR